MCRKIREMFPHGLQWGWIMEYQSRGVIHYHLFFERDWFEATGLLDAQHIVTVVRRGRETSIIRGPLDRFFVEAWSASTRCKDPAFTRFQNGGIVELFRSPDAAARYVAKESSKKHQKALPAGVDGGRRWWWASPASKPKATAIASLKDWPFSSAYGTVFDKSALADSIHSIKSV